MLSEVVAAIVLPMLPAGMRFSGRIGRSLSGSA